MRPGSLALGLLDSVLRLLALVLLQILRGLHCCQRRLDPKGLQSIEHLLGDGTVDPHPAEADAIGDGFGTERSLASISLRIATLARVLDEESSTTAWAAE